jgi:hypothetical protein
MQNGAHLKCAPAVSAHSDPKKASRVSFAWKRRNGMPTGKTFANALSFMARFRVQIRIRGLYVSCPGHKGDAAG